MCWEVHTLHDCQRIMNFVRYLQRLSFLLDPNLSHVELSAHEMHHILASSLQTMRCQAATPG